jgi:hypothetical protein
VNYPQQPPYGQQQPQQGYPGQQQGYAPPPQAPQYQQPGYPPQGPPPQQQYQQPAPQAPPELPRGTLQAFMDQPAGADGKSLAFDYPGDRYVGTVIRNVTDADVDYQTKPGTNELVKFNDDRYKLVMKIPLLITPSAMYPEGIGVLYANSSLRNEIHRAMQVAGADYLVPRAGDVIDVTYTHEQPTTRGMNARKVKRVVYTVGNGEAPQVPQYTQQQQPAQRPQYGQPQYAPPAPPVAYTPNPANLPVQGQSLPPGLPPQPPQYAPYPPPGVPTGMSAPISGAPAPGPYGQPQADWNPYAQQQVPPTAGAPAAPPPQAAPPTAPASPSSPPPDWPANVPFQPGLTVQQAQLAAAMNLPQVNAQQQ